MPLTEGNADEAAKKFRVPTDGTANVYVMRPYTAEPKEKSEGFLNGELVAGTGEAPYREHAAEAELYVAPGEFHYLNYYLNLLFNTVTSKAVTVDEKKGQSLVRRSKRAAFFRR